MSFRFSFTTSSKNFSFFDLWIFATKAALQFFQRTVFSYSIFQNGCKDTIVFYSAIIFFKKSLQELLSKSYRLLTLSLPLISGMNFLFTLLIFCLSEKGCKNTTVF